MGLNKKAKQKHSEADTIDNASKTEFGDQKDFFKQIDDYIKGFLSNQKDGIILNGLKELYQGGVNEINISPYCPIECTSEPDGKYSLTPEEVQLLGEINKHPKNSESRILGLKIEKLYKTTKIILCDGPNTPDSNSDLLGSYSHEGQSPSLIPVIRLYMDRITEASRLYCNRKYITASVYIHEMMHRFYDVRPDLGWKEYIKEIEEPMAVFGAMKFCEEFGNGSLLKVSRSLTEELQKSKWYNLFNYYVYILGIKMYDDSNVDACLIETYRHVSLMMHKESEVKGFDNPIGKYLDTCEKKKDSLENLVEPIKKCIETYAEFFPQDKGTK